MLSGSERWLAVGTRRTETVLDNCSVNCAVCVVVCIAACIVYIVTCAVCIVACVV